MFEFHPIDHDLCLLANPWFLESFMAFCMTSWNGWMHVRAEDAATLQSDAPLSVISVVFGLIALRNVTAAPATDDRTPAAGL